MCFSVFFMYINVLFQSMLVVICKVNISWCGAGYEHCGERDMVGGIELIEMKINTEGVVVGVSWV